MSISQAELYRAFDTTPDAIVAFLIWLVSTEHLTQRPHVADIGAGVGRLIGPLAGLGWTVTAYEPDPDYYPAAAVEAARFSNAHAVRGGFEDVAEEGVFSLACGINSSYAYLLSATFRTFALQRVRRSLRPGGLLVLDLPNFPWILANYRPPQPQERTRGETRIVRRREQKIDEQQGTFTTVDHDLVSASSRDPVAVSKTHVYAIVHPDTYAAELAAAGFSDIRLFSSFESRVPTATPTNRLVYVARRSAAG